MDLIKSPASKAGNACAAFKEVEELVDDKHDPEIYDSDHDEDLNVKEIV